MHRRSLAAVVTLSLAAVACASRPSPGGASPAPAAPAAPRPLGHPFASLAGERVAVVPVQRLRLTDSAAAPVPPAQATALLRGLDSAIAAAAAERGASWAFAADVARSARRNPTYAADPHRLAVGQLLPGRRPEQDGAVGDPLASQLRTLVALNDARYVIVPSELRVEPAGAGVARAVLRVALVDARAAQLRWVGEVASDPLAAALPPGSANAAATLAARFADLIAAP